MDERMTVYAYKSDVTFSRSDTSLGSFRTQESISRAGSKVHPPGSPSFNRVHLELDHSHGRLASEVLSLEVDHVKLT